LENTGRIFEDKVQQGKSGNVINTDLRNMQHRPKAWNRQTEAYTYWRKRDHCGWNGRQTYRLIRQISKERDLKQCSIVQIIHGIFVQKCILFTNTFAVYWC